MRRSPAALAMALSAALGWMSGCTSGFDRNDQIVNSLRILGVSAHVDDPSGMGIDWSDADVGDTIHLKALVANPGGLATVTVTWLACLPITGQTQPCTDEAYLREPANIIPLSSDPTSGVLLLGTGVDVDYQVPDAVNPLLQMQLANADAHVNAQCALYRQIPVLVIAQDDSNGAVFAAVRNLRLSPWKTIAQHPENPNYAYYVRNQNPTITAFNLSPTGLGACDGQPLATPCKTYADCGAGGTCGDDNFCAGGGGVFPDGPQTVCVATGQPQSYYTCGLDGPQIADPGDPPNVPEQPNVTWYMTAGSLSSFAPPANGSGGSVASRTFTGFTRGPGPFTIYGVVRDNRDGQNWVAQDFQ